MPAAGADEAGGTTGATDVALTGATGEAEVAQVEAEAAQVEA